MRLYKRRIAINEQTAAVLLRCTLAVEVTSVANSQARQMRLPPPIVEYLVWFLGPDGSSLRRLNPAARNLLCWRAWSRRKERLREAVVHGLMFCSSSSIILANGGKLKLLPDEAEILLLAEPLGETMRLRCRCCEMIGRPLVVYRFRINSLITYLCSNCLLSKL